MNAYVCSEVVTAGEGSATPLTLVTFLPGVSSDVVHQSAGVGKAPPAYVAFVGFLS